MNGSGIRLVYRHDFQNLDWQSADCLKKTLNSKIDAEIKAGFSLQGPQRDQYWLEFKNRSPERFFSQGEYKIAFFCLQMALNWLIKDKAELSCILLLDDLFAEIDSKFSKQITDYILSQPNQMFIAATQEREVRNFTQNSAYFQVEKGTITKFS